MVVVITLIAEAFVAVRPDLSEFAESLRAQLPAQISRVGKEHRQVQVLAVLDSASVNAVKDQLAVLTKARTLEIQVNITKPNAAVVNQALDAIPRDITVNVIPKVNDVAAKEALASLQKEVVVPVSTTVSGSPRENIIQSIGTEAIPISLTPLIFEEAVGGLVKSLEDQLVSSLEQSDTLSRAQESLFEGVKKRSEAHVAELEKIGKQRESEAVSQAASITTASGKPVGVKVAPDTTDFAESLRTQVVSKIASIGPANRQITILPKLTREFTDTLRTQLRTKIESIGVQARSILIEPVLDTKPIAAIRRELEELGVGLPVTPVIEAAAVLSLQEQLNALNLTVKVQGIAEAGVATGAGALGTGGISGIGGGAASAAAAAAARVREQIASGATEALDTSSAAVVNAREELLSRIDIDAEGLSRETEAVAEAETSLRRVIQRTIEAEQKLAAALERTATLEAQEEVSAEALDKAYLNVSNQTEKLAILEEDVTNRHNRFLLSRANLTNAFTRRQGTSAAAANKLEAAQAEADATAARLRTETQTGLARTRESTGLLSTGSLIPQRAQGEIDVAEARLKELAKASNAVDKQLADSSRSQAAADEDRLLRRQKILQVAREETQQQIELAKVNQLAANVTQVGSRVDILRGQAGQSATARQASILKERILAFDEQINSLERDILKTSAGQNAEALSLLKTLRLQSAEFVRQATLLDRQAPQLRQQALVQAAADRRSSQFQRGAFGGAAGFAGLRGAALAASAPFLLATIGITAVGKAIAATAELQRQLQTFGATSGATAEQMKRVADEARVLGADVKLPATSALDAAVAMTELSKAGLNVTNTLGAARGTLELAAAASIDASDAAQISASVLNQYELAGSKAARVTDVLAAASIAAQGSITDFAQGFKSLGSVAHTAGFSIEQSAALLTELGRAGLAGADGGTAIRTFLQRLVPQSNEAAKAMASLGVSLDHTRTLGAQLPDLIDQFVEGLSKLDPIARQDTLNQIFGARGIRAATIVFNQGSRSLEQFTSNFQKSGAAASLTEARMKGLSGAVDALGSSGSTFATTAGQFVTPALTSITHALTGIVNNATLVAEALEPILKVSREGIRVLPGGGDTLAQVGILAAAGATIGSQISKMLARRAVASKAAAEAAEQERAAELGVGGAVDEVSAAVQAQGAIWKKTAASTIGAIDAEVAAQDRLRAAVQETTVAQNLQNESAALGGAARAPGLKGAIGGLGKGGGAALGAGLLATVLGQAIGGKAGGALSAGGEGALFGGTVGSFFPVIGTAIGAGVGAAAFTGLDLLKSSREESKRKEAALKSQWQSMTFEQQQQFLIDHFPNEADPNAASAIVRDAIKGQVKTASASAPKPQQFSLPGDHPGLVEPGNINLLNRPPVKVNKDFGTVFAVSFEVDGKEILAPRIYDGKLHSADEAIAHAIETGQNLGTFTASPGRTAIQNANAFSDLLHNQQASLSSFTSATLSNVDNTVQDNLARTTDSPRVKALNQQKEQLKKQLAGEQDLANSASASETAVANAKDQVASLNKQLSALDKEIALAAGEGGGQSAEDFVNSQGGFKSSAENAKKAAAILRNTLPDFDFSQFPGSEPGSSLNKIFATARTVIAPPQNADITGQHFATEFFDAVAANLTKAAAAARKAIIASQSESKLELQLQLAIAQASNNTKAVKAAVDELIKFDNARIKAIEKQLAPPPGLTALKISGDKRKELTQELITLYNEIGQLNGDLTKAAKDAFTVSTAAQVELINAGNTTGLSDNLAAQQRILDETNKALEQERAKAKPDKDKISTLTIESARANADVVQTQQQIADQGRQATETRLRAAADAVGNIGAQEKALIAFLRSAIQKNAGNPAAVASAKVALDQEQKRMADAITNLQKSAQSVIDARLQNRLAAADLTPGTGDNRRALNAILASETRQLNLLIAKAKQLAKAGKKGTEEWNAAQLAIAEMNGKIIGTRGAIKNLTGGGGSFSLQDLFKAGVDNFKTFGSNIADRAGELSAQDARGSLGATAQRNSIDAILRSNLSESQKQTAILKLIYENGAGGRKQRVPKNGGRVGSGKDSRLDFGWAHVSAGYRLGGF